MAAAALVIGSGFLFWSSLRVAPAPNPVPSVEGVWLAASLSVLAIIRAPALVPPRRRRALLLLLAASVLTWWVPMTARQYTTARLKAQTRLEEDELALAGGTAPAAASRELWLSVRAAEHSEGVHCGRQRFFALIRFDEPVALQPPGFGNLVYYAGRDVDAARRAGPMTACDYVITTAAVEATDKGRELVAALAGPNGLRPFARTSELMVLATASK